VADLAAKLASSSQFGGAMQWVLLGVGGGLIMELLARPIWSRCSTRPYPLDRVLDVTVGPVVAALLVATNTVWGRAAAIALTVLRRSQSRRSTNEVSYLYLLMPCWITVYTSVYIYTRHASRFCIVPPCVYE